MKASKKYTAEEILHFVQAFAPAFAYGTTLAFDVKSRKTKNTYNLRLKAPDGKLYIVIPCPSYWIEDFGTFGGIEKLFKEKHPRLMLRNQVVTFDELIDEFGLDKYKLADVVFKRIKKTIADKLSSYSKAMYFTCRLENAEELDNDDISKKTPEMSTIDELMVWVDLNQGT